jgi:hypothetical protein
VLQRVAGPRVLQRRPRAALRQVAGPPELHPQGAERQRSPGRRQRRGPALRLLQGQREPPPGLAQRAPLRGRGQEQGVWLEPALQEPALRGLAPREPALQQAGPRGLVEVQCRVRQAT